MVEMEGMVLDPDSRAPHTDLGRLRTRKLGQSPIGQCGSLYVKRGLRPLDTRLVLPCKLDLCAFTPMLHIHRGTLPKSTY